MYTEILAHAHAVVNRALFSSPPREPGDEARLLKNQTTTFCSMDWVALTMCVLIMQYTHMLWKGVVWFLRLGECTPCRLQRVLIYVIILSVYSGQQWGNQRLLITAHFPNMLLYFWNGRKPIKVWRACMYVHV